jgi:hypothetical protein
MRRRTSFECLTEQALDWTLSAYRVRDQTVRAALLDAYRELPRSRTPRAASAVSARTGCAPRFSRTVQRPRSRALSSTLGWRRLLTMCCRLGESAPSSPTGASVASPSRRSMSFQPQLRSRLQTRGTPPAPLRLDCWCTGSIVAGPRQAWRFISGQEPRSPIVGLGWKSLGVLELTALPSLDEERWVPLLRDTDVLLVDGGDAAYLFSS